MILKQMYLKKINLYMSILKYYIEFENSVQDFGANVFMEDFAKELFNISEGWNLINMNEIKPNHPSIDLGDEVNKISIQVTYSNDSTKINDTLKLFDEKELYKKYGRVIIFLLQDRKDYKFTAYNPGIPFDKDDDIIDFAKFHVNLSKKDTTVVQSVYNFLKRNLKDLNEFVSGELMLQFEPDFKRIEFENGLQFIDINLDPDSVDEIKQDLGVFVKELCFLRQRTRLILYHCIVRGDIVYNDIGFDKKDVLGLFNYLSEQTIYDEFNFLKKKRFISYFEDTEQTDEEGNYIDTVSHTVGEHGWNVLRDIKDKFLENEIYRIIVKLDFTLFDK